MTDYNKIQAELNECALKYPNAKISYYFAKDKSNKGYIIQAKEDNKIIYSSYKQ